MLGARFQAYLPSRVGRGASCVCLSVGGEKPGHIMGISDMDFPKGWIPVVMPRRAGFLHPSSIDLLGWVVRCGGGCPGFTECPAASLASTHWCGKQNVSR